MLICLWTRLMNKTNSLDQSSKIVQFALWWIKDTIQSAECCDFQPTKLKRIQPSRRNLYQMVLKLELKLQHHYYSKNPRRLFRNFRPITCTDRYSSKNSFTGTMTRVNWNIGIGNTNLPILSYSYWTSNSYENTVYSVHIHISFTFTFTSTSPFTSFM